VQTGLFAPVIYAGPESAALLLSLIGYSVFLAALVSSVSPISAESIAA